MPHSKLMKVLQGLIDAYVNGGFHKYTSLNWFGVKWVSNRDS